MQNKNGGEVYMPRKDNSPKIKEVLFYYIGTDEQFNLFLKSVIDDYIGQELQCCEEKLVKKESKVSCNI